MQRINFKKAAIIGVGLIGGSIAINLRKKGFTSNIVGIGRGADNLKKAVELGVIDSWSHDIAEGVKDADLVIVAVPVLKVADAVKKALPALDKGAIITDVGSVKEAIINEIEPLLPPGIHFVPGHPIAGTEHSGVEAAFETLFIGRKCILTPTEKTDKKALAAVTQVWEAAGSHVVIMGPKEHDRALAAISHLPHIIAYTLVNTVSGMEGGIIKYSAGGFRDFTRIASSSPEMWSDICAMNKDALLEMVANFQRQLEGLKKKIAATDTDGMKKEFEMAKKMRDSLLDTGKED